MRTHTPRPRTMWRGSTLSGILHSTAFTLLILRIVFSPAAGDITPPQEPTPVEVVFMPPADTTASAAAESAAAAAASPTSAATAAANPAAGATPGDAPAMAAADTPASGAGEASAAIAAASDISPAIIAQLAAIAPAAGAPPSAMTNAAPPSSAVAQTPVETPSGATMQVAAATPTPPALAAITAISGGGGPPSPEGIGEDASVAPGQRWVGPSVSLPQIAPPTQPGGGGNVTAGDAAPQTERSAAAEGGLSISIIALPSAEIAAATRITEPGNQAALAETPKPEPTQLASLGYPAAASKPDAPPSSVAFPPMPTPRPVETRSAPSPEAAREPTALLGLTQVLREAAASEPSLAKLVSAATSEPAKDVPRDEAAMQREVVTLARFETAAASGYPNAQYNLAIQLLTNESRKEEAPKAVELLTKAAEQNFVDAQIALAVVLTQGEAAPRDMAAAAFWSSRAAERGNETAKAVNQVIEPTLTPTDAVKEREMKAEFKTIDALASTAGLGNQSAVDAQLREAAMSGDEAQMMEALVKGANADSRDGEGRSALINATWRGHVRIVEALLARGADTELADRDGRTAVVWGAINGHVGAVQRIIQAGGDYDVTDRSGMTAMMHAAWNGFPQTVSALIRSGVQIDRKDNAGKTALDYATQENQAEVIKVLNAAKGGMQQAKR